MIYLRTIRKDLIHTLQTFTFLVFSFSTQYAQFHSFLYPPRHSAKELQLVFSKPICSKNAGLVVNF